VVHPDDWHDAQASSNPGEITHARVALRNVWPLRNGRRSAAIRIDRYSEDRARVTCLRQGDIILTVAGLAFDDPAFHYAASLEKLDAGLPVEYEVLRGDTILKLTYVLSYSVPRITGPSVEPAR